MATYRYRYSAEGKAESLDRCRWSAKGVKRLPKWMRELTRLRFESTGVMKKPEVYRAALQMIQKIAADKGGTYRIRLHAHNEGEARCWALGTCSGSTIHLCWVQIDRHKAGILTVAMWSTAIHEVAHSMAYGSHGSIWARKFLELTRKYATPRAAASIISEHERFTSIRLARRAERSKAWRARNPEHLREAPAQPAQEEERNWDTRWVNEMFT